MAVSAMIHKLVPIILYVFNNELTSIDIFSKSSYFLVFYFAFLRISYIGWKQGIERHQCKVNIAYFD